MTCRGPFSLVPIPMFNTPRYAKFYTHPRRSQRQGFHRRCHLDRHCFRLNGRPGALVVATTSNVHRFTIHRVLGIRHHFRYSRSIRRACDCHGAWAKLRHFGVRCRDYTNRFSRVWILETRTACSAVIGAETGLTGRPLNDYSVDATSIIWSTLVH